MSQIFDVMDYILGIENTIRTAYYPVPPNSTRPDERWLGYSDLVTKGSQQQAVTSRRLTVGVSVPSDLPSRAHRIEDAGHDLGRPSVLNLRHRL